MVGRWAGSRVDEKADLMDKQRAVSSVVKRAGEKAASTAVYWADPKACSMDASTADSLAASTVVQKVVERDVIQAALWASLLDSLLAASTVVH